MRVEIFQRLADVRQKEVVRVRAEVLSQDLLKVGDCLGLGAFVNEVGQPVNEIVSERRRGGDDASRLGHNRRG